MPNDAGTVEILEAIQSLATQMDERFEDIERRMATKEDLKGFATKEDLQEFKNEIVSHVD